MAEGCKASTELKHESMNPNSEHILVNPVGYWKHAEGSHFSFPVSYEIFMSKIKEFWEITYKMSISSNSIWYHY